MANIATLNIGINAVYGGALGGFKTVVSGANAMSNSISAAGNRLSGFATSLAGIGLAATGLGGSIGTTIFALRAAADAEQTEIAFTTMLSSAEKAKKLIDDITTFAINTPFELPGLKTSAKQLIAFGTESEQVIPVLKTLGDVAAGVSVNVDELVLIYGHAQAAGRVMNKEINQLTARGIPIINELAKVLNVSSTEIRHMAKDGEISFGALQQAFVNMSGPSGKFANLMGQQSKTLGGLWSNLKDSIGISLMKIGQSIVDAFDVKGAIANLTTVSNYIATAWVPVFVNGLSSVVSIFSQAFNAIGLSSGTVIEDMRRGFIIAFATAEYVAKNFGHAVETAGSVALYSVVSWTNYLSDFLTRVWPTMGENFVSSSTTFFKNWAMYVGTILTNLKDNFFGWIDAVIKYIASGGTSGWDYAWKPLTEGFQAEIAKIQPIAERQIPAFEQALAENAGKLLNKGADDLWTTINKKLQQFKLPETMAPKTLKVDPVKISQTKAKEAATATIEQPKALVEGSKEALNAIARFRLGQESTKTEQRVEKNTADAVKVLNEIDKNLKIGNRFEVANIA